MVRSDKDGNTVKVEIHGREDGVGGTARTGGWCCWRYKDGRML